MNARNVSNRLDYGNVFEDWEVAVAKSIARGFCGPKQAFPGDDLDDLIQEALIHWLRVRPEARHPGYMRPVVRNKFLDLLDARNAHNRRVLAEASSLNAPVGADPESDPEKMDSVVDPKRPDIAELRLDLEAALDQLTPRERQIAELKSEGHGAKEIAKQLQLSRETVHKDINRIRKFFEKRDLKKYLK